MDDLHVNPSVESAAHVVRWQRSAVERAIVRLAARASRPDALRIGDMPLGGPATSNRGAVVLSGPATFDVEPDEGGVRERGGRVRDVAVGGVVEEDDLGFLP